MPTTASTITRSPVDAINSLSPGDRRVLNENELAQRWGLSPKTLQRWRSEGRGPRYLKLSKRVSYPPGVGHRVRAWRPARLDLRARGALKGGR
jgi:hypothetical protein